ncbi:MAG: ATP-binding protein [Caulobacteraceae bacterium]
MSKRGAPFDLKALRRPSLVRSLIWMAAVLGLIALVTAGGALTWFFQHSALGRVDASLNERFDDLHAGTTVEPDPQNGPQIIAPALTDQAALRVYSGHYWEIAEPDGKGGLHVLVPSRSLFDGELKPPPDGAAGLKPGARAYYNSIGPNKERVRVAARAVTLQGYPRPVVFLTAEDRSSLDHDSQRFGEIALVALALVGLALIGGVILQVRVGLRPLFRLQKQVADVRMGKADRVGTDYPVELTPLAGELNALLDHNQEVVERQRTHVGNLAHALKTPLAVMQAEAEQRPDDPLAEVVTRQAMTMREQVDHHLRRARAAARAQGSGERTEVAPVLDELSRTLERIFGDRGVSIDWEADDDLVFRGERQDLLELIGNVMENACKWSRRRVRAEAQPDGPGFLKVTVEDDGPGLPEDQREAVLRRGARLDESAPGSGLGLSIVEELAKAYGGSVSLGESVWGGLKVDLRLPQAEA